jgi:hypothetical protein
VDEGLAAVQTHRVDDRGDGVVGHGKDGQLDFVEDGGRLRESAGAWDQAAEPLALAGVAAGDRDHRPAGAAYRHSQRRTDWPGPDDADAGRPLAAMLMRVRLDVGVDQVAVAVATDAASRLGRPQRILAGGGTPALAGIAVRPPDALATIPGRVSSRASTRASTCAVAPQFHATFLPVPRTRAILAPDLHLVADRGRIASKRGGRRPPSRV